MHSQDILPLWFEDSRGQWRKIAECHYWEVEVYIRDFIAKCNENKPADRQFVSYYTRAWQEPYNDMWNYDVGSHTEFFHWGIKNEIST